MAKISQLKGKKLDPRAKARTDAEIVVNINQLHDKIKELITKFNATMK